MSYKPEISFENADYWEKNEGHMAHGYPGTSWLQIGLLYGTGLYTAKQQGLVGKGVVFAKFWGYHYFDWITYIRRAGLYAGVGGMVAGTILFGSPELSMQRMRSWYACYFQQDRPNVRGDYGNFLVGKF